jgi:hypothetical protein
MHTNMAIAQSEGQEDLLTSEEVIQRLHANAVLRRAALTCVLPAVRTNGHWRFRRSDLEAWIARQLET